MPPEVNSRQIIRPTPRLPRVVSSVQPPAARTGVLANSLGKILIDIGQKQPETSIANQIMVHRGVLRRSWKTIRSTPLKDRNQVIRLFEGTFFENFEEVDQKPPNSPRLAWLRSSTWNSTELRIGDLAGDGTLAIQNGGSVSSSGISYIGTFSDSTGAVTVDGSGSTWTTSGALYVGGDIGVAGGSANLTVQGGGLVDVGTLAKVWGAGQVNLAAGTINAAQFELAGGTLTGFGIGNAEITGGSTITATGGVLTVGNAASTRGSVFLDVLLDGDYDDSGDVALGDLNLVLFDWNEDGSVLTTDWIHQRPASGTTVGLAELNGVLFNWGNSAAVATVPEPTAGRLSVLGVLALGIRRRR